jgi:hypothetical protein
MAVCDTDLMASLRAEALLLKKALDDERKLSCVSRDDIPEPQPRTDSPGHSGQPKPLDNKEKSPCAPKTLQSQSATNPTGPSGHPGRAESTCTLSQDPGLTDEEKEEQGTNKQGHKYGQGYKNSEGHNRNNKNSITGIQNTIVILLSNSPSRAKSINSREESSSKPERLLQRDTEWRYDPERLSYWDTGWTGDFVMRMNNKINKDLPPEYRIQILMTVTITGWINQLLRDIEVPNSRTTLIMTRVKGLFMDPAVPSLISRGILKLESEKLTGALQSPPKRSQLVERVSWNPKCWFKGVSRKQSLLRPEPRLGVTSIFTSNLKGYRTKESVGTRPLLNTQCPIFALFQCSLVSPLFRFAYSGSGVALFTPFVYSGSGIPNRG